MDALFLYVFENQCVFYNYTFQLRLATFQVLDGHMRQA